MSDIQAGQSAVPLPSAELNLGGTSTVETLFKSATASGGVAAGSPLQCRLPGSNTLKNRPFVIRLAGRVTGGGTTNFTAQLYLGNTTSATTNAKLATTGAIAVNSSSGNFLLETKCMWDSTSGKIGGYFEGYVNATAVAQVINSTLPTSVDLSTEANLNVAAATTNAITCTGTFSSGFAGNLAIVDVFEVLAL